MISDLHRMFCDFEMRFGKKPSFIRLPHFRKTEIIADISGPYKTDPTFRPKHNADFQFCGVPGFWWNRDYIEIE